MAAVGCVDKADARTTVNSLAGRVRAEIPSAPHQQARAPVSHRIATTVALLCFASAAMSGLFDEQAEQLNLALYAPHSDRFDDSPAPPAPSAEDAAAALANRLSLLGQALASAGLADADFPSALARADQAAMAPHQLAAVIDGLAAVWGDRNKIQSQMHEVSEAERVGWAQWARRAPA